MPSTHDQIYLGLILFIILLFLAMHWFVKNIRKGYVGPPQSSVPELPPGLPKTHPIGWVYVTSADIKQAAGSAAHAGTSLGMISLFVRSFFCNLSLSDVYDVVMISRFPAHAEADWDGIKRGLTIGSVLFNYPIPPSFVLIDDETASYYQIFMTSQIQKLYTQQWLDSNDTYEGWLNGAITAAELAMQLTVEEAILFFHAHHEKILKEMQCQIKNDVFPICDAFTKNVLTKLGVNHADERQQLYFRIALSIILDLGEMRFPSDWMFTSTLTNATKALITGTGAKETEPPTPNKPSPLTLVVNK